MLNEQEIISTKQSVRQRGAQEHSRVYDKFCSFCEKKSKYVKGTHSREPLIQAVEAIRDTAVKNRDERLLAITSRDIVAAEAHYHASSYKLYTYSQKDLGADNKSEDDYAVLEGRKKKKRLCNSCLRMFRKISSKTLV